MTLFPYFFFVELEIHFSNKYLKIVHTSLKVLETQSHKNIKQFNKNEFDFFRSQFGFPAFSSDTSLEKSRTLLTVAGKCQGAVQVLLCLYNQFFVSVLSAHTQTSTLRSKPNACEAGLFNF